MKASPLKVMVDTNVWVDYFLDRNDRHETAMRFVLEASADGRAVLYTASVSLKDVYYLICMLSKRSLRADNLPVTKERATAVAESAWSSVRAIIDLSIIVPVGQAEVLQAAALRSVHDDFEDDLVMAAAKRASVDFLVTSDDELLRRSPVGCLALADAFKLLMAREG